MSDCPTRPKKESTIILQPNRSFDTEAEMNSFLKRYHPNMIKVHKVWRVEVIRCEIVIPEPKAKR